MREWSGRRCPLKFDGNSICLCMRYPDKEVALLLRSFQDDHSLLRSQVYSHALNRHLYHSFSDSLFRADVRRKSYATIVHLSEYPAQISNGFFALTQHTSYVFFSTFKSITK